MEVGGCLNQSLAGLLDTWSKVARTGQIYLARTMGGEGRVEKVPEN
jgi:hypothetical protein